MVLVMAHLGVDEREIYAFFRGRIDSAAPPLSTKTTFLSKEDWECGVEVWF